MKIQKCCVLGSGTMGSKIAALFANTGMKVIMLDMHTTDQNNRNYIADIAIQKLLIDKSRPIVDAQVIDNISTGNFEDNLSLINECDLIIEAILEDIEVKRRLFSMISHHIRKDAILASNTSTFLLSELRKNIIHKNFLIIHFFNPPKQMKLVEIVHDSLCEIDAINATKNILTHMDKKVVICKDSSGFIANRIGCFLLLVSLHYTSKYRLSINTVDAALKKLLYIPNTAIFGLYDLIGIDVVCAICNTMQNTLSKKDRIHEFKDTVSILSKFIQNKTLGKKTNNTGFYRIDKTTKSVEAIDLQTFEYRKIEDPLRLNMSITEVLENTSNDPLIKCMQSIVTEYLSYATAIIDQISYDQHDVDIAMHFGYGFKYGPIEYIRGQNIAEIIMKHAPLMNIEVPEYLTTKKYLDADLSKFDYTILSKLNKKTLFDNESCTIFELENKICFALKTKMNTLDIGAFEGISRGLDIANKILKPMYIYNDFKYFCCGGNLEYFLHLAENEMYAELESFLHLGQRTFAHVKQSDIDVISCAKGMAIGGGTELLLHSTHINMGLECVTGLVESKIGLIPSWGGLKETILGSASEDDLIRRMQLIIIGTQLNSAYSFTDKLHVEKNVTVCMNEESFLSTNNCKSDKLILSPHRSSQTSTTQLLKHIDLSMLDKHTQLIAHSISELISTNGLSEEDILDQERAIFITLIKTKEAQTKIKAILK